ncbi:MAG: amidohydrolase [Actinomycetia bacterium]|nr:amidohydrolase [Actinomycetes bacterium]MCP4221709.1 amidohydrolase [Actinomycetes bacterium]MCP5033789.1 amidohydrolase [Actinomycetes bacterium]
MTDLTSIGPDLLEASKDLQDATIELRRAIHAEPEIGLQLPVTQAAVIEALTGLGLDVKLGESTTSVVADLDSGKPGPTVLLRGDMDALPLTEDYVSDYKSRRPDAMHACGHDAHVAMLASAARLLSENKDQLTGKVRFMFQPGEEGYHGAQYMIEEGVLEGVDRAFAIHVVTNMPNGLIATKGGPVLASADTFEITVNGRGGHASAPHQCIDPIPAAAAMVGGLHNIVSRNLDPMDSAVLTVGHIEAGTTNNIIPASAYLEGTIRTFDEDVRRKVHDHVHQIASGTAASHGCTCSSEITRGYPVTSNDDGQAQLTGEVATALLGKEWFQMAKDPAFAAEDFSYVLNEVPGAMAMLGVCPDDVAPNEAEPNHSNLMRVNESALAHGVGLYAAMALVG